MTLEKYTLPPSLMAKLYPTSLVSLSQTVSENSAAAQQIKFLGSNQKQITILVNETDTSFLSDKSFTFLTGILTACGLNVADVAIVNIVPHPNIHFNAIHTVTQPHTMLLFGISPEEIGLPLHFPDFQVQRFNNTVYVCAPMLGKIEADKSLKTKLWAALKSAFQL